MYDYRVAVAAPLEQLYVYSHQQKLAIGTRVRVVFGKRRLQGVVLEQMEKRVDTNAFAVKEIEAVLDCGEAYFSPVLLAMARFISAYYFCPLGWVLAQMSPNYSGNKSEVYQQTQENSSKWVNNQDEHVLTAGQQEAFAKICVQQDDSRPILLRGVTGAGKTELYLRLIKHIIEQEDTSAQVLLMIPEIALTVQMVRVLSQRFPQQVVVVHSGMTPKQRWDVFQRLRSGACSILLGPRSSIFAPFVRLRLLVVDEEHDSSYKQDSNLAYNARDLAIWRAKQEGARVLLGSATPSLESWHNVLRGKYRLVELLEPVHRVGEKKISLLQRRVQPQSELDTPVAKTILSPEVCDKIKSVLAIDKQVMVIINRRGYSRFLLEQNSNEPVCCPNCSVSLTLHIFSRRSSKNSKEQASQQQLLRCHYCDYRIGLQVFLQLHAQGSYCICGYGSQQIEQVIRESFPDAVVERLDSDTVRKKAVFNEVLTRFRAKEIQILVGTQMLAKGHDFPSVSLLVLLHAEQMLWLPDFRAAERTYQLLVQAMGRTGRSNDTSEVVIESSRIDLPIIRLAVEQNYELYVKRELAFRAQFAYPPYVRMACFEFYARNAKALSMCAERISRMLVASEETAVRGPCDPPIAKINNVHRKVVYFSARNTSELHRLLQRWLTKIKPVLASGVKFRVDVDPQMIL